MSVIKNLFHVSLQADKYEEALEFYCGKLGFEQMFELNVGQFKDMLQLGEHNEDDKVQWLTYLRIAPEEYLEMFNGAINPPDFKKVQITAHEDSPFESFGLGCYNVEETVRKLKNAGVSVTDGCITDPNGVRIRIVEDSRATGGENRIFHSLAGVSLYVNDLNKMVTHFNGMGFVTSEQTEEKAKLILEKTGQYVEFLKSSAPVTTYDDDILGHIAIQIYSVPETVDTWAKAGLTCCPQPFLREVQLPADGTAKGNIGLDRCEIIWMICPEGNKVEVMAQPGDTMQQEWEREHPY